MLVVDGFFENGVFVPEKPITAIKGRQRAVLNIDSTDETSEEKRAKGQEAFQRFTKYLRILSADFDYKKELAEYRDERYGNID